MPTLSCVSTNATQLLDDDASILLSATTTASRLACVSKPNNFLFNNQTHHVTTEISENNFLTLDFILFIDKYQSKESHKKTI